MLFIARYRLLFRKFRKLIEVIEMTNEAVIGYVK